MIRKSHRKRVIIVMLAGLMLLSTGCNGKASNEPQKDEKANGGQEVASSAPLSLSMALMGGPKTPNSWVEQALEEQLKSKLNRDVDIVPVFLPDWSEMNTKINLLMGDKDSRPNILWTGETKEFSKWVKAGVVQDVTPALQKYGKEILNYYTKDTMFYHWDASGKIFRIPGDVPEAGYMTTIIRKDWLDKLGLEVPKTLDEYVNVLRAFTFNDPDDNGQKDTYGFSGDNYYRSLVPFFYAHGVDVENFVKQEDGSVKYGAIMPETKTTLQLLAELYREGIMDPRMANALNNSNEKVDDIYVSGKVGSFYRFVDNFNPGAPVAISFKQKNPNAELISIDPVTGPDGFGSDLSDPGIGWCYLVVTDTTSADEAIQVLNVIAEPEVNSLLKFGKEGEHYAIENGQFVSKISPDQGSKLGMGNFDWVIQRKDFANIKNTPEVTQMFEQKIETSKPMKERIVVFKALDRPEWDKYSADINKLRDETFWGIITGKLPLTAFDDFAVKYAKLGGEQIDKEANELYSKQAEEYEQYDKWYEENITPFK